MDDERGKKLYTPHDRNEGVWIEHDDSLYCAAYSSVASLTVSFAGYFRKANGEIVRYEIVVTPTSDRAVTATQQVFGAGFLLSCAAYLKSGNANRGQCYVRAGIRKGSGTPLVVLNQIVGGYVTDEFSPSFPFGRIMGPLEGMGYVYGFTVADPGAGNDVTKVVPSGALWRPLSVRVKLTADANAANREVELDLLQPTAGRNECPSGTTQVANEAKYYNWQVGQQKLTATQAGMFLMCLPDVRMRAGASFDIQAINITGGDAFSLCEMIVEEWLEA